MNLQTAKKEGLANVPESTSVPQARGTGAPAPDDCAIMQACSPSTAIEVLIRVTAWLVPIVVCAGIAWLAPGYWRLPVLLAAQACAVAGSAHVLGVCPLPPRRLLSRMLAHMLLQGGFAAWLWLLTAWPLLSLARAPSLAATLVLSLAFGLALASLWNLWPWSGWLLLDQGAVRGSDGRRQRAMAARVRKVLHATSGRPDAFMLPAGLSQLASSYFVLALAGLMPWPWQVDDALALGICLLALLPLTALLMVWRCLRAARAEPVASPLSPAPAPESAARVASLSLEPEDTRPGRRERALLEAARAGDTERALALLAADADPSVRPDAGDPDQRSVLVLSTLLPDTRLLRAVIARGASVHGDGHGLAPLLIAVRDGRRNRGSAVMTLLANGADVTVMGADGDGALHLAALGDEVEIAAMLVDAGADINALNRAGCSPLALACQAGNRNMVAWLLEHGAQTDIPGAVPALVATADASDDLSGIAELLITRRARVDGTDVLGRSALIHAALSGHEQLTATLLAAGAAINHADLRGTTALMEAARAGANNVLRALAEQQPDPGRRDQHGRDALMLACQSPRADADTVRILLELGADPRAPGQDGRSPLDHAATAGRWNLVALMDPDTPLPASHCDDLSPESGADSPAHLLDALRFGHWAAVSGFRRLLREWPMQTRVELYLELLDPEAASARRWLFENGLAANARHVDGRHLAALVLDRLPAAMIALDELLGMGQGIAGRGLLAQAMRHLGSAAEGAALVPKLLQYDADLFGADDEGMTPLHHAARHGMSHSLNLLLANGCDPNVRDREGQTPLHHALKVGSSAALPLVRALIAAGADPEAADAAGETPLGQALEAGDPVCTRWLRWGPWHLPGRALRAADLPQAAAAGDAAAVERLLELGFDIDTRDSQGATALIRACGNGHPAAARVLLDAGADVGLSSPGGATALTAAVTANQAELVSQLLEHGAELDQKLRGGATALLVSAALGHAEIAHRLLKAGADVAVADDNGRTALHAAAQFCFGSNDSLAARRLLDVLLEKGADAARTDQNGASVLLFMLGAHARPGSPCNATHLGALLPVLLDAGAPPNAADERGVTPLHACAMHALAGPVRLLLARGANRSARDNHNRTPADVARILGFVDIAHELRPG